MKKHKSGKKIVFIWLLAILNASLAFLSIPISDSGDSLDYIHLAESFLGHDIGLDLSNRSPLYSIVLAGFMLFVKPPLLFKLVIFLQYTLLAITSWLTYRLFQRVFVKDVLAILTALLFNCSLSTINHSYFILPDILGVFLLILSLHILLKLYDQIKLIYAICLGVLVGLLALARFNTVPLIATYVILCSIVLIKNKKSIHTRLISFGVFVFSYLFIINAWCLYNQSKHGFYGLFPHIQAGVSRNVTVASIRSDYIVSADNKPVLEIFLEARARVTQAPQQPSKGSLLKPIQARFGEFDFLIGGYLVYLEARPHLLEYFKMPESAGEYELALKLNRFYKEISAQNQTHVLKSRLYSLVNSFRASNGGALPPNYGRTNLNILPSWVFQVYKLAFFFISLIVFFAFFLFALKGIKKSWTFDFTLLATFILVFSFWGINITFVTTNDANIYKFPIEPLVFGLFVYYAAQSLDWIRERR